MGNDATNIFTLALGAAVGATLCTFIFKNDLMGARAYASEELDPREDPNLTPAQRAYAKMMIEKNARTQGLTPDELVHQQPTAPKELQGRFDCQFYTNYNGRKIKICKDNPLIEGSGDMRLIPKLDSHGRIVRGGDPLHPYSIAPPGDVVGLSYPMETNQTLGVAPAGEKAYSDISSTYARAYASQVINCDQPKPWNANEIKRYDQMPISKRAHYLITREQEFQKLCKQAAREINQDYLESADPGQTNLKYGLKYPSSMHNELPQFKPNIGPSYDDNARRLTIA